MLKLSVMSASRALVEGLWSLAKVYSSQKQSAQAYRHQEKVTKQDQGSGRPECLHALHLQDLPFPHWLEFEPPMRLKYDRRVAHQVTKSA